MNIAVPVDLIEPVVVSALANENEAVAVIDAANGTQPATLAAALPPKLHFQKRDVCQRVLALEPL